VVRHSGIVGRRHRKIISADWWWSRGEWCQRLVVRQRGMMSKTGGKAQGNVRRLVVRYENEVCRLVRRLQWADVWVLLLADTTFTCTLHFTLPTIGMGARLLLMTDGVNESLCAQLNSNTRGTDSFIRVLTCIGSDTQWSRHYRKDYTNARDITTRINETDSLLQQLHFLVGDWEVICVWMSALCLCAM
jgi:hypothetical protein